MLEDDFNYALEGFGGVFRKNVDPNNLEKSTGPQDGEAGAQGGAVADANSPSVDQLMAQDALQKYMRAESFYALTDMIPNTSGIVDSGRINTWNPEARLSSVYAMVLQNSQVYNVQPDGETKKQIDRWRSFLITTEKKTNIVTGDVEEIERESNLVKAYNEKMLAYLGAAMEYNNTRISAMAGNDQDAVHRFAINASLQQMKVRAAMSDWSANGYKGDYENLTSAIQSVEERSFTLLKQRYKEDFARSLLTNPSSGANFLYTAPAVAGFARSNAGWSEFYFNSGSFASNHRFKSSTSSARGAFSIGGFSLGGGGKVSKQRWEGKVDAEGFNMSFKMCRMPIYRAWFHLDFVKSGFWRFDQNNEVYKNSMVSDGKKPPEGLMPAITTDCIFIKDLKMHFGKSQREFVRKRDSVSGRGGVSFGPIWGGGSHTQKSDQRSYTSHWEEQGIRIPGLQLLGFVCHTLDQSPNPNPNIRDWI